MVFTRAHKRRRTSAAKVIQRAFRRFRGNKRKAMKRAVMRTSSFRGRVGRKRLGFVNLGSVFPNVVRVRLPYHILTAQTQADGAEQLLLTIRPDSIFGPATGSDGAHQPFGFDQMSSLYTKYRVTKFTMRGVMRAVSATNDTDIYGMIQADCAGNILTPTGTDVDFERGRWKMLRIRSMATSMPKDQIARFKMTVYPASLVKKHTPEADNPRGWASVTQSPIWDDTFTTTSVPNIAFWARNGEQRLTASVNVVLEINCTYWCEFRDPVAQTISTP